MNYAREVEKSLKNALGATRAVVLYGARQVGKTTLVKNFIASYKKPLYIQSDDPKEAERLTRRSVPELLDIVSGHDVVVFDEAQQIEHIGTTLKLIADNSSVPIIATGSSSFELANKLSEPLTGRKRTLHLYPLSVRELVDAYGVRNTELKLESLLLFGSYPRVVATDNTADKKMLIAEIARDYLFRDLFMLGDIRNPFAFEKVVQLLALRVGSEVSYTEIAKEAGISRDTVFQYVTLLERAFIVFRLTPFYRNKTKELVKSHKIYFYDVGIRNALIGDTDPLAIRADKGALLENFFIAEKMKRRAYDGAQHEVHFWRTRNGSEVDFVEAESGGRTLRGFECKWKDVARVPEPWTHDYPQATFIAVNAESVIRALM